MTREQLMPYHQREMDKWAAEPFEALRAKLGKDDYVSCDAGSEYHVEVQLLENRDDYLNVSIAVCSDLAEWSCFRPGSANFLVYRDGRVDKPARRAASRT